MKRKYNNNDILRYLYGEMEPREQDDFLDALCTDDALFKQFEMAQEVQKPLDTVELSPSKSSVDRVMHYAGTSARRRIQTGKAPAFNKGSVFQHHFVSVGMVFFTCIMVAIALFAYKMTTAETNSWSNSKDALKFENRALDQRLQFAKERLGDIIDNQTSTPISVHHDTYRLVNTDLSQDVEPGVVLLNIK